MLTEDKVINLLCDHLRRNGWTIQRTAMPDQQGIDIEGTQAGVRLEVEAKGEGSSKPGTKRYGKPFTRTQVQHRVGEALLTALAVASRDSAQAAIAVPDIRLYHSVADPVLPALHRLGIIVFWVGEDGTLKEDR
jgi:hypothetical protein